MFSTFQGCNYAAKGCVYFLSSSKLELSARQNLGVRMLMKWDREKRPTSMAAVALACALAACPAMAADESVPEIYRCVAKDGRVVFSDGPTLKGHTCRHLGIQSYTPPSPPTKSAQSRMTIAQAKKIAADAQLDPEATRFREVYKSRSGAVCGALNAKNLHGGYVGYSRFVVTPEEMVYVLGQGSLHAAQRAIVDNCFS